MAVPTSEEWSERRAFILRSENAEVLVIDRPRLRLQERRHGYITSWWCLGNGLKVAGVTPLDAYERWRRAVYNSTMNPPR